MITYDTETCGLHGVVVLIQYAIDDGEIHLHNVWTTTMDHTLKLIEFFMNHKGGVVGFNLAFDHFHLQKIYNMFSLYKERFGTGEVLPCDVIDDLAELEPDARDGMCIKPVKACDLMLVARRGPYQSCMERKDIYIRRVPTKIAFQLANELENRVKLKDIYFKDRNNPGAKKWHVEDIIDGDGKANPDFKNVVLKFKASAALKELAIDALGIEEDVILRFSDVEVDHSFRPVEYGYAPFALAHKDASRLNWQGTWPAVLKVHIDHWEYSDIARVYASKDVVYTRGLYEYFGRPELGDPDSDLACQVASVRWKGFKVDLDLVRNLKAKAAEESKSAPKDHHRVKEWLFPLLTQEQIEAAGNSTAKVVLEEIAEWTEECSCVNLLPDPNCAKCKGEGEVPSEAALRCKAILHARKAEKEETLYDKLIQAGRFHASFRVIGALSGRMSGSDDLNPQAINKSKWVRAAFTLAPDGMALCGGDFDAFEVGIGVAIYDDPNLEADLNSGKKIHALFGQLLFPDEDYDSILLSDGSDNDMYKKSKSGLFSLFYGGTEYSLIHRLGIDEDIAKSAMEDWPKMYPGIGRAQLRISNMFKSMRQPGGLGSKIEWHEPADSIPTLLGFRRYYTLENMICKALFDLGSKPPESWKNLKFKVTRRVDRGEQTTVGACQSALFGAAFGIQSANVRSATNHEIQGTGAGITKVLQHNIWKHQPSGIHPWVVMPMNIHDEVMAPCKPEVAEDIKKTVDETIQEFKSIVPRLGMTWKIGMNSWAEK